jgi:hypothetical protein
MDMEKQQSWWTCVILYAHAKLSRNGLAVCGNVFCSLVGEVVDYIQTVWSGVYLLAITCGNERDWHWLPLLSFSALCVLRTGSRDSVVVNHKPSPPPLSSRGIPTIQIGYILVTVLAVVDTSGCVCRLICNWWAYAVAPMLKTVVALYNHFSSLNTPVRTTGEGELYWAVPSLSSHVLCHHTQMREKGGLTG